MCGVDIFGRCFQKVDPFFFFSHFFGRFNATDVSVDD